MPWQYYVIVFINNMANVAVVERTLALIKPDALDRSEEILDVIRNNGFTVLQVRGLGP